MGEFDSFGGTYSIDLLPLNNLGVCPLTLFLGRLDPLVLFLPEFVKRLTDAEMAMPTCEYESSTKLTSH
jgi:hypothetical protein